MTTTIIEKHILSSYELVVGICNNVMRNAGLLGIHLDVLQNPTVEQIVQILDVVVIPTLDKLGSSVSLSPDAGMKVANIRQYALHLRELQIAISEKNVQSFDVALNRLKSEAMI
jgi:hypothetical protein